MRVAAIALLGVVTWAQAAPFIPADDAQVLERVPARNSPQARELDMRKAAAAAAPADVASAVALADLYYRMAQAEGDPRYLGYAQATLARWWNEAEAPTAVLVTRATIRQSSHEFDAAVADLSRAIARDPRNARALLVRATVRTVQGRYEEARADCARLAGLVADVHVVACRSSVDSLNGKAQEAIAALQRAQAEDAGARAYVASLAGEIAHRLSDASAESLFRASLAADPRDLYTIGAYSDWLLDQGRPADVLTLVAGQRQVDALLLRLALAQKALNMPEAGESIKRLRDRFAASRARGDTVHRREEARYALQLADDRQEALRLASENWAVQKEPADLRILAEAAAATGDKAAQDAVRQWLAATRLQYAAVSKLASAPR